MTDPGRPGHPYGGYSPYPPQGTIGREAPVPQAPYGVPPSPYGTPVPAGPPERGGPGKVAAIVVGVLVVLLAICGGLGFVLLKAQKGSTSNAKVNDCIWTDGSLDSATAKPVNKTKIVPCGTADAQYKVVGIVAGKTESDFTVDDNLCDAYQGAGAKWELWQGTSGRPGQVLCLAAPK